MPSESLITNLLELNIILHLQKGIIMEPSYSLSPFSDYLAPMVNLANGNKIVNHISILDEFLQTSLHTHLCRNLGMRFF